MRCSDLIWDAISDEIRAKLIHINKSPRDMFFNDVLLETLSLELLSDLGSYCEVYMSNNKVSKKHTRAFALFINKCYMYCKIKSTRPDQQIYYTVRSGYSYLLDNDPAAISFWRREITSAFHLAIQYDKMEIAHQLYNKLSM